MKKGDILHFKINDNNSFSLIGNGNKIVEGLKPEDFKIYDSDGKELPNKVNDLGNNTFEIIFKNNE